MRKMTFLLATVLVGQVVLTALLFINAEYYQHESKQQMAFLAMTSDAFDKLVIEAPGESALIMQRQVNGWVLPQQFNYPVMMSRLNAFIAKLTTLEGGWPKATTAEAAKRFRLTADDYERALSFYQQGQLVEMFYLGASPGFRKVYVRKAAENNIYAVELSAFDASIKAADWYDYTILKLDVANISEVEVDGLHVYSNAGEWQSNDLIAGERINDNAFTQWLNQIGALRFDHIVGKEAEIKKETTEVVRLKYRNEDVLFSFSKSANGAGYVLKRSDLPYYLGLSLEQAVSLLTIERTQFVSDQNDSVRVSEPGVSITIGDDEESIKVLQDMLNSEVK